MNYLKVEGHETLVRDTNSKAIISTSDREYQDYMLKRKAMVKQSKLLNTHAEEIENIKKDLSEIKNLLIKIIEEK